MNFLKGKGGVSQWTSVCFIFGIIAILGVVAQLTPAEPVEVCGVKLHFPDLRQMFAEAGRDLISVDDQLSSIENDMRIDAQADSLASVRDSTLSARADSLRRMEQVFGNSNGSLRFPKNDYSYLFPVYEAMRGADSACVHVFHYGDSQIEGDRITQIIRDSLQSLFGGSGPGMLPLWQPIPCRTVSQTVTDSVATYYAAGIMGRRAKHDRYGAMAQMAELRGEKVTMTVTARGEGHGAYRNITVFVGSVADTMRLTLDSLNTKTVAPCEGLRSVSWRVSARNSFRLTLEGRGDVYGIEVDGGRGVTVTNIPMRGADGLFLQRMDANLSSQMMRRLNTRLVIMEFGGNALPMFQSESNVDNYCSGIGQQIERMKALCPEARIIFIGPADMSVKVNGTLQTHELLPLLTQRLAETCDKHDVAFWDMYDVMGGWNSMIAWVEHQPQLAGTDYVHFTTRGANRIASILWKAIKMNYDYMLIRDEMEVETATPAPSAPQTDLSLQ